jgi:hypothetical protein
MKEILKLVAILFVFVGICAILPVCCTNPDKTIRILERQGYRDIIITGWRPFMKEKNELFSTGFHAVGENGKSVSGAVTGGGLFKGYTVRFD